jgi:hypothetical protein
VDGRTRSHPWFAISPSPPKRCGARGIELDVLLLEAVRGYESYVCMTPSPRTTTLWVNFNSHS